MAKIQNQSTKNDPVIKALPAACADELKAVEFMEEQRWNGHSACPRCGAEDVKFSKSREGVRIAPYIWTCTACRKAGAKWQFTVRTGTVLEDSKIPLRHWCFAFWRASTSKKGVSALEIHRQTGLSYKSSLFLLNRIRFAMSEDTTATLGPNGGDVEVDETYVGGKPRNRAVGKQGHHNRDKKACVLAAVERGGKVRVKPVANVTAANVKTFIRENVHPSARILSDSSNLYWGIGKEFERGHESVNHSRLEYVRGDVHSNTIEGFFANLKRGLTGIHHAVSKEHLSRYLDQYAFLYNHRELSDGQRALAAIQGAVGKRLFYKAPK
jgi:transposase-like protein